MDDDNNNDDENNKYDEKNKNDEKNNKDDDNNMHGDNNSSKMMKTLRIMNEKEDDCVSDYGMKFKDTIFFLRPNSLSCKHIWYMNPRQQVHDIDLYEESYMYFKGASF